MANRSFSTVSRLAWAALICWKAAMTSCATVEPLVEPLLLPEPEVLPLPEPEALPELEPEAS